MDSSSPLTNQLTEELRTSGITNYFSYHDLNKEPKKKEQKSKMPDLK